MNRFVLNATVSVAAVSIAIGAAAGQSAAPEPAKKDEAQKIEKVVVTAQRRKQRLLDVPASITAITAEDIEKRGAGSLQDMQTAIPGLSISQFSINGERVQLRGVSQQVGAPTVGIYMDEVSIAPQAVGGGAPIRIFDLERIEVLRGPQPTLYGEGSMGGTIRYITAAPDLEKIVTKVAAELGTIKDGGITGLGRAVVSLPLVKGQLAVRIAGQYEDTGGYIDSQRGDDVNGVRFGTIRGRVLWEPSARFSASLLAIYQNAEQDEKNYATDNRVYFDAGFPEQTSEDTTITNLVLTYDAGPVTLLSSTGLFERDGLTDDFLGAFGFGFRTAGESERRSQEFRLTSNGDSALNYLLGFAYTENEAATRANNFVLSIPPEPVLDPPIRFESTVWAIYGEAGYDFGAVDITVGARYFEDDQSGLNLTLKQKFESFNPRVNVSYEFDGGGVLYANAAKGFRTGGFNTAPTAPKRTFAPEILWTYEAGYKRKIFGGDAIIDASIYYNAWEDIQIPIPSPGLAQGLTVNAGEASGLGIDVTLTAYMSEYLTVVGTLGWNNMEYDSVSLNTLPGDPLDLVPSWTGSIALDYQRPIATETELFIHVDAGYMDEIQNTLRSITPIKPFFPPGTIEDISVIDGHESINANIGIETTALTNSKLRAYVYGKNLTDDFTPLYAAGTVVTPKGPRPRPMTIGLGIAVDF